MIKRTVAYLPCWGFFWLGHWVSLIFEMAGDGEHEPWWASVAFNLYSWCMRQSAAINDWAGLDVWERLDP